MVKMHGAVHPVQSKAALPPERNIYIQKIDNCQIFYLVLDGSVKRKDEN